MPFRTVTRGDRLQLYQMQSKSQIDQSIGKKEIAAARWDVLSFLGTIYCPHTALLQCRSCFIFFVHIRVCDWCCQPMINGSQFWYEYRIDPINYTTELVTIIIIIIVVGCRKRVWIMCGKLWYLQAEIRSKGITIRSQRTNGLLY